FRVHNGCLKDGKRHEVYHILGGFSDGMGVNMLYLHLKTKFSGQHETRQKISFFILTAATFSSEL
ncbi:hypothetical protein, partial [Neisseria sp.]|uniref:hypothetical protein n=1 Tax=Neisseria sp. TaxID=192066 RepID=UPI00343F7293